MSGITGYTTITRANLTLYNSEEDSDFSEDAISQSSSGVESEDETFNSHYNLRSRGSAGVYDAAGRALAQRARIDSAEPTPAELVTDSTVATVTLKNTWTKSLVMLASAVAVCAGMYLGTLGAEEHSKQLCDLTVRALDERFSCVATGANMTQVAHHPLTSWFPLFYQAILNATQQK